MILKGSRDDALSPELASPGSLKHSTFFMEPARGCARDGDVVFEQEVGDMVAGSSSRR